MNGVASQSDGDCSPEYFAHVRRKRAELADPSPAPSQLPHSVEAEQGVLGCILLDASECIPKCQEAFKAGSEVFHDLRHRSIYERACEVHDKSGIVDLISITEQLRRKNQLEGVGGLVYVASLPDAVPSAANLGYYLDIVLEKFTLRRMIGTCTEVVAKCYEFDGEVDELMDEVERDILSIADLGRGDDATCGMARAITKLNESLEAGWTNPGANLKTGFSELDYITSGLSAGELITIGAGSSEGKTVLLVNIAAHNAKAGMPCGIFTFEMPEDHLTARMISAESGIPWKRAEKGLNEGDMQLWSNTSKKLLKWPIQFCYCRGFNIGRIKSIARRWVKDGVKLIGIDYLQLVKSGLKGRTMRHEEIGYITGIAKEMAGEFGIPVILLSQLSREHKKKGERPQMHDLRESGSIEHDSDKVLFLYRTNANSMLTTIEVAKHRNGPKGRTELNFNAPVFRFEVLPEAAAEI